MKGVKTILILGVIGVGIWYAFPHVEKWYKENYQKMKKSTKIIIMISLVAILGTAAYFIYDTVAKEAQGEFRQRLASQDIYNPEKSKWN